MLDLFTPTEQVTGEDIASLVADEVVEATTLDYKEQLPDFNIPEAKAEFLADVSSFANARGGHLIYGIKAPDGIPKAIRGLDVSNQEAVTQRATQILRSGLKPPIRALDACFVQTKSGYILLVQVPRSLSAPHMINCASQQKYHGKYYGRTAAGKNMLEVSELRELMRFSEELAERIRLFRIDRILRVQSADMPIRFEADSLLAVLHLVPFDAFGLAPPIDLSPLYSSSAPSKWTRPVAGGHQHSRHNIDGYLSYSPGSGYTQFFRNGCVES